MIDTNGKTVQEVVDAIAEVLDNQGIRCMTPDADGTPTCSYGDGAGNHCALGWLMPEDREDLMNFKGGIESLVGSYLNKHLPDLGPNTDFILENRRVLCNIQTLHDSASNWAVESKGNWEDIERVVKGEGVSVEKLKPFFSKYNVMTETEFGL